MNQMEIKRRQIQLYSMALGMVVIWILGKSVGDNGITYLTAAMQGFSFIWIILCANVPDVMGKLLRGRNAKGQYKNAAKLRHSILFFQAFLGILGSLLFLLLAKPLAELVFQVPHSKFLMMLLAPAVFLSVVNAVILGTFQGEGSELPTVVAGVLRPVFILGFGLLFGKMLAGYGEKVSNLLGQDAFTAMYGGVGVVIAILLSEILILLFLFFIFKGSGKKRRKRDNEDGMRTMDSYGEQIAAFYGNRGMSMLLGFLMLLPFWIGLIFYQKSVADILASVDNYGIYVGKYLIICLMISFCFAAMLLPLAIKAAGMLRKEERRVARNAFQTGIKLILIFALYATVLLAVMGKQVAGIINGGTSLMLTQMYTAGSGIIVFGVLAYFCYIILKLSGNKYMLVATFAVADMIYAIMLAVMLGKGIGILALVYAGLIYVILLAVALCVQVCIQLNTNIDLIRNVAIPMGCACVAGLVCFVLGKVLTPHLGDFISFIVIFALSGMFYLMLVVFLRCFSEQELRGIPGGRVLRGIGQLLGVF